MHKRIYGLENEHRVIKKSGEKCNHYNVLNQNPHAIKDFITNGAKLYVDQEHVEYATPECLSVLDVIAYEKAGNAIVFDLFGDSYEVLKSSQGWEKGTCGYHENYLIERKLIPPIHFNNAQQNDFTHIKRSLLAFLTSRQILCGAGGIVCFGANEHIYQISPRANHINTTLSLGTTHDMSRAIINTRDEPHADKTKYFRLHLILSDANMSDISLLLKVGTTGLMLRMIESGAIRYTPNLKFPIFALQAISQDPTCKVLVELTDGRRVNAVDLQEIHLEQWLEFAKTNPTTDEEQLISDTWEDIISKLRRDPMECYQEIDWVIKLYWTKWYQDQTGLPLKHEDVRAFAYSYHNLDQNKGIYLKLLNAGEIKRLITEEKIQYAKNHAPNDTRAKLRGDVIKTLLSNPEYKRSFAVNWEKIKYASLMLSSRNIPLWISINIAPFETENKEIDWAIEQVIQDSRLIRKYIQKRPRQLNM